MMKESQDNIIEILKSMPKIKHTFSRKNNLIKLLKHSHLIIC